MNSLRVKQQVRKILVEFQLGDLKNCRGANFLAAIGLMVATEFLGGLLTGTLGQVGKSRCRFEEGFRYLGPGYSELVPEKNAECRPQEESCEVENRYKSAPIEIYENVRCGLVHQYLPSQTAGIYSSGPSQKAGIIETDGNFSILIDNYIRDLEAAAERLLKELETDEDRLKLAEKALKQIPSLA